MSRRPEGTDGSDWSYREVVESRYKRMAVFMSATFLLHQVQSAVVFLKVAYLCVPFVIEERLPPVITYALAALLVGGNIAFYMGKPRGRCILPLMKGAALAVMGTLALLTVNAWKYYQLDPKTLHTGRRLYKVLRDRGTLSSPAWLDAFAAGEMLLDAAAMVAVGVCFYTFNTWVRDAMDSAKEREERNKAVPVRPPPGAIKKRT